MLIVLRSRKDVVIPTVLGVVLFLAMVSETFRLFLFAIVMAAICLGLILTGVE